MQEEKMTQRKSNLKSIKSQNVNSYYSKNWKVITIYLIIVTVIIELIVKMTVTLMNNNNNNNNNNSKKQYFHVKKQTLIQSKSARPSILNVKRPNIRTNKLTHKL